MPTSSRAALPTWDQMEDLDKGAALIHLWKREYEGDEYAISDYPCRYLANPLLMALDGVRASEHAVTVTGGYGRAQESLGDQEYDRLYDLAVVHGTPTSASAQTSQTSPAERYYAFDNMSDRRTNTVNILPQSAALDAYLLTHSLRKSRAALTEEIVQVSDVVFHPNSDSHEVINYALNINNNDVRYGTNPSRSDELRLINDKCVALAQFAPVADVTSTRSLNIVRTFTYSTGDVPTYSSLFMSNYPM